MEDTRPGGNPLVSCHSGSSNNSRHYEQDTKGCGEDASPRLRGNSERAGRARGGRPWESVAAKSATIKESLRHDTSRLLKNSRRSRCQRHGPGCKASRRRRYLGASSRSDNTADGAVPRQPIRAQGVGGHLLCCGSSEMSLHHGEQYAEEALQSLVETMVHLPPEIVISNVIADVNRHLEDEHQADDMTILIASVGDMLPTSWNF